MKPSQFFKNTGKVVGLALTGGMFVMIFGIYWQLGHGESADYDAVKQAINQYGEDLNEMREYLYLPANNYDFFKASLLDASNDQNTPEDKSYEKGVMMFAQDLAKREALAKKQDEAKQTLTELIKDKDFSSPLKASGLTTQAPEVDEANGRLKIMKGKGAMAQILLDLNTHQYSLQSILGVQPIQIKQPERLKAELAAFVTDHEEQIIAKKDQIQAQKEAINQFLEQVDVKDTLSKNKLTLKGDPVENADGFEYFVTDLNGAPLLAFILKRDSSHFVMDSVGYPGLDELRSPLLEKLKTLNGETQEIKAIRNKKQTLEDYLNGDEMKGALEKAGLKLLAAKENDDQTIYDLVYVQDETPLGSIIFDNQTGELRFIDAMNGTESSLEEILSGSKKKP